MTKTHLVLFDIDGTLLHSIDGTLLHSGGCGRAATLLALQDVFGTVGAIDDVDFAGKTDWQILLEALEPAGFSGQAIQTQLGAYNEAVSRRLREIIAGFPVCPCAGAPEVVSALRKNPAVVRFGLA